MCASLLRPCVWLEQTKNQTVIYQAKQHLCISNVSAVHFTLNRFGSIQFDTVATSDTSCIYVYIGMCEGVCVGSICVVFRIYLWQILCVDILEHYRIDDDMLHAANWLANGENLFVDLWFFEVDSLILDKKPLDHISIIIYRYTYITVYTVQCRNALIIIKYIVLNDTISIIFRSFVCSLIRLLDPLIRLRENRKKSFRTESRNHYVSQQFNDGFFQINWIRITKFQSLVNWMRV